MKYLILIFLFASIGQSCDRKEPEPWDPIPVPESTSIKILQNQQIYSDSQLSEISLFYLENSTKVYLDSNSIGLPAESFRNQGLIGIYGNAAYLSADGTKEFYLEFPDGSVDTMFIDYQRLTSEQGREDPCRCIYPLRQVKCNGIPLEIDPGFDFIVYILNKD